MSDLGLSIQPRLAPRLALKFSEILTGYTSPFERIEILGLNEEYDASSCASHDFVDANEVMNEAFESLGLFYEVDFDSDLSYFVDRTGHKLGWVYAQALWNRAWDIAKTAQFYWTPDDLKQMDCVECGSIENICCDLVDNELRCAAHCLMTH
jgi:hypothetical protein